MDEATVEKKEKGEDGTVSHWLKEIELSEKVEKDWRKDANDSLKVYAGSSYTDDTHDKRKETFNILWANVETKRPALYNSLPNADVRRRYKDKSVLGKAVSEVLERAINFTIDDGFDEEIIAAVNDMLLPGRAITRVKYVPTFEQDPNAPEDADPDVAFQEIQYEQWQWDRFRRGPGRTWKEVTWIAFEHRFKKDTFEKRWPNFAENVSFETPIDGEKEEGIDKTDDRVFKTCRVWEIWDKETRQIIWIAPSYKDKAIEVMKDPLGLDGFFNIPRPLYAIENPVTLVPACEYTMYETLAKELENLTRRINRVTRGLKLRGIYDSTLAEIEKLFDEDDNGFIPAGDVSRAIEEGGLDKAIWMLPVKEMAEVLVYLYQRRESLIGEIYEITGISDIQRGNTDPDETLGAQQIKANFGSQRLQRQQTEVQRYIRDIIRITAELIGEHFTQDMLAMMTGVELPTEADKQGIQAQIQMMSMSGQQPGPRMMEMLNKPSWEQVMGLLQDDVRRNFLIDIETDSTVQKSQIKDQEAITGLLTGIMNFVEGMTPAVQSGLLPMEAAKKILMSAVRRFDLGREVEDALESMGQQQAQKGPDPEQIKAQVEQQKAQLDMQKMKMEAEESQRNAERSAQEHAQSMQELARKAEISQMEHAQRMREINQPQVN